MAKKTTYWDDADFIQAWNAAWDCGVTLISGFESLPNNSKSYCVLQLWHDKTRSFQLAIGASFMEALAGGLDQLGLLEDYVDVASQIL